MRSKCDHDAMMMIDHHERRRLHHDHVMMMMRDVIDRIHAINNGPCELFYQPHVNGFAYTSTFDSNKNHSPWLRKQQRKQQQKRQPLRRPQKKQPLRRPLRKLRRRSKLRSTERVEGPEQSGPFAFLVGADRALSGADSDRSRCQRHLLSTGTTEYKGSCASHQGEGRSTRCSSTVGSVKKEAADEESAPLRTRFPFR